MAFKRRVILVIENDTIGDDIWYHSLAENLYEFAARVADDTILNEDMCHSVYPDGTRITSFARTVVNERVV